MLKIIKIKGIHRIIDANINRGKEGLRVCEEISRFILESSLLTSCFKDLRHKIDALAKRITSLKSRLKERRSCDDIGLKIRNISELKRKNYQDIFFANIQRTKESVRVLEEFAKLVDTKSALNFKRIRYRIYELEKTAAKKFTSLYHNR